MSTAPTAFNLSASFRRIVHPVEAGLAEVGFLGHEAETRTGLAKVAAAVAVTRVLVTEGFSVLLSAIHTDVLQALHHDLEDMFPALMTLATPVGKRQEPARRFAEQKTPVLVAHPLTLQGRSDFAKVCSDVVFVELGPSTGWHLQVEGRIARLGAADAHGRVIRSHYMVASGGTDPEMIRHLGFADGRFSSERNG